MINHCLKIRAVACAFLMLQCFIGLLVCLPNSVAFADGLRQGKFFIGADLGAAQISLKSGNSQYDDGWLYGALWGEYGVSDRVLLGVEGAGWTDQKNVNDLIAEDVMAFMMTAKVYPWLMSGFYVKAGWGYIKHRYWETSAPGDAAGTGSLLGFGFGIGTGTLQISYSRGEFGQGNYNALTLSTSFPFYVF